MASTGLLDLGGVRPATSLLLAVVFALSVVVSAGDGASTVPSSSVALTNQTTRGGQVKTCSLTTCRIHLFRRLCVLSRVGSCPQPSRPKSTECCYTGCCEPEHGYFDSLIGKFWLIFGIFIAIGAASIARYWCDRHYLSPGRCCARECFTRRPPLARSVTPSSGPSSVGTNVSSPSLHGAPPAYGDALNCVKADEFDIQLPAYDDLSLHESTAAPAADAATSGYNTEQLRVPDEQEAPSTSINSAFAISLGNGDDREVML